MRMNYKALYDYCKDISENLGLTVKFFHGRKEWINLNLPNKPLYIHLLPFTSSGSVVNGYYPTERWNINLLFYMQDDESSGLDENDTETLQDEMNILTITEQAASKFIREFNNNDISDALTKSSERLTIVSWTKGAAIKDTSAMLTGIALNMVVQVPDDFDYCC